MKLCITAKCSDLFSASLLDERGKQVGIIYFGYVPSWMPEHGGDYVELDIDIKTGKILNWKPPTKAQLAETFKIN